MAIPMMPTASTLKEGGIPDPALLGVKERRTLDLTAYYNMGVGTGAIKTYTVTKVGTSVALWIPDDKGKLVANGVETNSGMVGMTGVSEGLSVITVVAVDDDGDLDNPPAAVFTIEVGEAPAVVVPVDPVAPSIALASANPAKNTRYTIMFKHRHDVLRARRERHTRAVHGGRLAGTGFHRYRHGDDSGR